MRSNSILSVFVRQLQAKCRKWMNTQKTFWRQLQVYYHRRVEYIHIYNTSEVYAFIRRQVILVWNTAFTCGTKQQHFINRSQKDTMVIWRYFQFLTTTEGADHCSYVPASETYSGQPAWMKQTKKEKKRKSIQNQHEYWQSSTFTFKVYYCTHLCTVAWGREKHSSSH